MSKSKQVRDSKVQKIKDYLDKWQSDKDIMKRLRIPESTYYRYKASIYEEDKQLLDNIRTNELSHRILKVRNSLEYCISVNQKICETSKDDKAKIEASAMIVKAQMGLLNLTVEPPYDEKIRIISRDVNAIEQNEDPDIASDIDNAEE